MENVKEETKKAALLRIFSEDIELFGKFFFGHYLKNDTPSFHKEIYALYENEKIKKIALGAPRG